ncbi:hypothetical protein C8J45_10769 [Sphingomonas sp. PP-CE-3G-477]|uniref:hypothetical protein n=1 Tax=Sphingomonas sp. PP-CE-3G-477 TaxID=2135660 RepID=UPI000D3D6AB4|nr:hypothetical protein [Sphingomonas sp. PP-CE-3G-477]PTQ63082.1 hypothetical protein C8J45_10769 [Sphingomonas sp. PP-CE-3G-477]
MGFSRLFRSRWAALFWSAGILWTAYDVASDAPEPAATNASSGNLVEGPTDATGATYNAGDLAALANATG